MDRNAVLEGERQYLAARDEIRKPIEERLFGSDFRVSVLERGYLLPGELAEIAYWKWHGTASRVQSGNSEDIVRRFSAAAIAHRSDPRLAAWVLTYLHGVHVRMASAILTVLFPEKHTVMDARAWSAMETLGWQPDMQQVFGDAPVKDDFLDRCSVYEIYLDACRAKAAEFDVSLRTLDRFLYMRGTGADG